MANTQPEGTAVSYETVIEVQRGQLAALQWEVTMLKARNVELEHQVDELGAERDRLAQAETDRLEAEKAAVEESLPTAG